MSRLHGVAIGLLFALALAGCDPAENAPETVRDSGAAAVEIAKSAAAERAGRRLFDGAPPVVPHAEVMGECTTCHNAIGVEVEGRGYAPPTPHALTPGVGLASRCVQCHVVTQADGEFRANDFAGLRQDLRAGERLSDLAPPVMPHPGFMRENCLACHSGPAAREAIRTDHAERERCEQCHLEQQVVGSWTGPL